MLFSKPSCIIDRMKLFVEKEKNSLKKTIKRDIRCRVIFDTLFPRRCQNEIGMEKTRKSAVRSKKYPCFRRDTKAKFCYDIMKRKFKRHRFFRKGICPLFTGVCH